MPVCSFPVCLSVSLPDNPPLKINYVSAHDNETLFDVITIKVRLRVREAASIRRWTAKMDS